MPTDEQQSLEVAVTAHIQDPMAIARRRIARLEEALRGQREYHLHRLMESVSGSMGEASERGEIAEIDALLTVSPPAS